jgi:hypothetical protein
VIEIIERDLKMPCQKLTLKPGIKVRKAVIPAAGFGTRLFPASKATKKELFPIVDQDGIAKPAILLIVEEALEAGIEEVYIIVQEEDLDDFRSFSRPRSPSRTITSFPGTFRNMPGASWRSGDGLTLSSRPARKASATPSTAPVRRLATSLSC